MAAENTNQNTSQNATLSADQHWINIAKNIDWITPWKKLKEVSFHKPVSIKWYLDGKLNVSVNCVDRHMKKDPDKIAYIFEPDNPQTPVEYITYQKLYFGMCRMANILKKYDVKKGDRVTIYLPMIPEAVYAMLACARIGAVHSLVFAGFSDEAIADRINDCQSAFVITANESLRGGKHIPLKGNVDEALTRTAHVRKVLVVEHTQTPWKKNPHDLAYAEELKSVADHCEPEVMDAEDPLYILYTSGSTGKPKGVLHTSGGYLAFVHDTFERVFNYQPGQIFWCTADVGWVTGHSYIVYGALSNGATSVLFEGIPTYPAVDRFWQVIDKHKVEIFYTAPTAIRSLMREGLEPIKKHSLDSLKVLGSVGEPINPEAWLWYSNNIGKGRCPVVDTWWQTETGGILISATARNNSPDQQKPGSATKPLPGLNVQVLSPEGKILEGAASGLLVLADSWPGQMRTIYKNHQRFEETYFTAFPGYYFTSDGCNRDADGDYWITGRVDDVLNISGHRLGTAEIESAFVSHKSVAEAAVVGYPHDIKGQGIYAYVTLRSDVVESEELKKELIQTVRHAIGPIATPDKIQWAQGLPKTRSGKILRRILRKIAENELGSLGDTTTLADPGVVQELIKNRVP